MSIIIRSISIRLHLITGPWILRALFSCGENEGAAMRLERFIKKNHSKKLIEKLIDPDFVPEGRLAQLVRAPYVQD